MNLLPAVAVDRRIVENEQPAVDQILVAPAATGRERTLRPEDPIGAVRPRVVQKISQRKQVRFPFRQLDTLPVVLGTPNGEHHITQVNMVLIGTENIRTGSGHERGSGVPGLLSRLRVGAIDRRTGQDFAGLGFEPVETDPAVQVR